MDNDKDMRPIDGSEATAAPDGSVVVRPVTGDDSADGTAAMAPDAEYYVGTPTEGDAAAPESAGDTVTDSSDVATVSPGAGAADNGNDGSEEETESDKKLRKAIADQAREDERPHSSNFTLAKILGGDILTAQTLRNNIGLMLLIVGFIVVYITNRYKVQKDLLEIDKLNTELEDAKYKALSISSTLTEKSRESHVLESLKNGPDSALKQSDRPPYIIEVPDK
ncbi:MAG: FtsL-like putative cell division protein [Prevotella sp.]|uniref:FtsL-like putative cell division protein n=1 Tax=Prevotella sp. TaxID=59823 RepID=UPI002586F840|nr:FtsL-like putative cell division protein [Prevotella sp.]MDD6853171.1 FtsL-like putative cell division protein [Prevotella sp.]